MSHRNLPVIIARLTGLHLTMDHGPSTIDGGQAVSASPVIHHDLSVTVPQGHGYGHGRNLRPLPLDADNKYPHGARLEHRKGVHTPQSAAYWGPDVLDARVPGEIRVQDFITQSLFLMHR